MRPMRDRKGVSTDVRRSILEPHPPVGAIIHIPVVMSRGPIGLFLRQPIGINGDLGLFSLLHSFEKLPYSGG